MARVHPCTLLAALALFVVPRAGADADGSSQQLVEVFEVEARLKKKWELVRFSTASGRVVDEARRSDAPPRWSWASDWIADGSRGDDDGWEYSPDGSANWEQKPASKSGTCWRRRRWLRVMKRKGKKQKTAGAAEERKVLSGVARSIDFFDSEDVTTKRGNPLLYCGRQVGRGAKWVKDDFTFRGFGLGCSRSVDARSAGLVLQLPLTPNFGFWERRSRFLPMATGLVIVYPPAWDAAAAPSAVNPRAPELSDAMREAKRLWARTSSNHFVMVVILSISYPVDILRSWFKALAKPFAALFGARRNRDDARTASDYGARSVKRVGFSLSRSVTIVDEGSTLAYHASPLRWRPWFMYAPGLTLLYRATEAAFEAVTAGATRTLKRLKAAEQEGKNATAADDAELSNATVAKREAPGPLRRLERRTAEACLDATSGLRAWCDSKTSLLGYSVLPYMAHLTDGDDVEPVGFKPWKGSVLFMMRPFYPARPFGKR